MITWLIISVLTAPISMIVMPYFNSENQWLIYDHERMIVAISLSFALYLAIPFSKTMPKCLAGVSIITSLWVLADYHVMDFLGSESWRLATGLIFVVISALVLINIIHRAYEPHGSYNAKGSLYCYRKPKGHLGLFYALMGRPYGHKSVIIDGVEYTYKDNYFTKRKYIRSGAHSYAPAEYTRFEMEEKLGERFGLFSNCARL